MSILRLTRNKGSRYVTFQVTISQSYILHLTRLLLLKQIHWFCEDCGTEYDTADIESRLINHIHRKLMRYQMQDIRCSKTNRVSSNSLARVSDCGADFKQDFSSREAITEFRTLKELATRHELDDLLQVTKGVLASFR